MTGKVYLVGAGPGDPELLTVRAARLLREAEVILYDRLVAPEILAEANPRAALVYAGKQAGEQETAQPWILEQMIRYAEEGRRVVRLKGGDPFVFGRGAEEWHALAERGIEVEVVPGLSSAVAVPESAGIPLTFRGIARAFTVVTGQGTRGFEPDWREYAQVDTLIILMGVAGRARIAGALIAAGRPADEPVAFVENGTTRDERVVTSTLEQVAAGEVDVSSPAVFVVGEVVRLREQMARTAEFASLVEKGD
ncbi:MAG TPA: uroporphyrinogen-III C-methyltransferase [Bryobacteraceae bacterium]|nr:uroporphyrinogen-III C-methyltransferase [Bryobacteraceae bacterium]